MGNIDTSKEKLPKGAVKESFHAPDAKLLIVDDNLVNLKVVTGLLARTQVQIETAVSGAECLKLLSEKRYDMVLLDHMMPQMDGIETLHKIREMKGGYYGTLPVVALTATMVSGAKEMFQKEGFTDYVIKPIDKHRLEEIIIKYLPEQLVHKLEDNILNILDHSMINVENGVAMFGQDKDQYIEILQVVLKDGRKKIPLIKQYLLDGNIRNFTTEVHALKSVAANIGANGLSLQSKKIENAAREDNREYIEENIESLLGHYQRVLDNIEEALNKKSCTVIKDREKLPGLSYIELHRSLIRLRQLIEDFEQDDAIELLDILLQHEMESDKLEERLKSIKESLQEFDFQQAFKLTELKEI